MSEVIVALDFPSAEEALGLVDRLGERVAVYKVGLQLHARAGPGVVRALRDRGKRVFLDLKCHDIPTTVARTVEAAAEARVDFLTVHVAGGASMLAAAREAGAGRVRLLGVTLLTSLPVPELEQVWGRTISSLREEVRRLAGVAAGAGLDGVVASVVEAEGLKRAHGAGFLVVSPGIRLPGQAPDDQNRVATPGEAARAGVDYVVVGRAVIRAPDPVKAVDRVREELAAAPAAGT